MLPAHQRLEPDDDFVAEPDDRLVVDAQLAPLQRGSQVVLEVEPVHRLVAHRRLEQEVPRARVALGSDHRDLGLTEQLVRRGPAGLRDGDAERGADEPLATVEREGSS